MPNVCIVVGCSSRSNREVDLSFFRVPPGTDRRGVVVPSKVDQRQKWIAALQRANLPEATLKYGRICSKHFVTGI